jgi:hypothetical protein
MSETIQDITIPTSAITTCPNKSYALVGIAGICQQCPYFQGLFDVMEQDAPFAKKYRVRCGVPQVREIINVEMGVSA